MSVLDREIGGAGRWRVGCRGGPTSHVYQDRLRMLADALPEARLVTVPSGHRVHTKEPDQFIDSVVPFLTRNAPRSSS